MTENELKARIESQTETPNVDFKAPMDWDRKKFLKDILAMANTKDGGHIIVGVSESQDPSTGVLQFIPEGMSGAQLASYDIDVMRDQIKTYVEPYVDFNLEVLELETKKYAIIRVSEFELLPVICSSACEDVKAGHVYYRTMRGRAQSLDVSHSHDMRDIVERSTVKQMRHYRKLGLSVPELGADFDVALDSELGDLK